MTTKTLVASLAAVAASSVLVAQGATEPTWSTTLINAIGFENFTVGTTPSQLLGDNGATATDENPSYFLYESTSGSDDASTVTNEAPYTGTTRPGAFAGLGNANYLSLSTESGTLFRSLNTLKTDGGALALGDAETIPDAGLYVDTLVQFTPCEEAPTFTDNANKLAVWLNVSETETEGVYETNLCVRAGYFEGATITKLAGGKTYTLANTDDIQIEAGEWVRLTVKAIKNVYQTADEEQYSMPAFQVYINDTLAVFDEDVGDADALAAIGTAESAALTTLQTKTVLPSMGDAAALQAVGFQGTGAIDDFVVTTDKPSFLAVDFTLFWDANITALEVYLEGVSDPITFTESEKSNLAKIFEGLGDGDTVEIDVPGESDTAVNEGYEIDWAKTVLTNVVMEALIDESDNTLYGYLFTAVGEGPYSITLVTKATTPTVTPDSAVVVDATSAAEAITKVQLSIDSDVKAAGQEAVVKLVATETSTPGKWNVTVVINEEAEAFVDPDEAVAEVAGALSGTGETVSIAADKLTPGLYYSLGKATAVDGPYTEQGTRELATGSDPIIFNLGQRGTAGFFKVFVNMTAE